MKVTRKVLRKIVFLSKYFRQGGVTYVTIENHNDPNLLNGKNIIITGGTSGIGFATAEKCIQTGAKVLITGRNEERLRKTAEQLGENAKWLVYDISDINQAENKCSEALRLLDGRIDALVNNAGIVIWSEKYTEEDWDSTFDTNLKGSWFFTRAVLQRMKSQKIAGNIVMVSSIGAIMPQSNPYALSKAAVSHMVEGIAAENMRYNIRCNGIAPGETVSNIDLTASSFSKDGNLYWDEVNNKRVHLPEEMAEIVCFLLSDNSSAINGQVLVCDSGHTLCKR